ASGSRARWRRTAAPPTRRSPRPWHSPATCATGAPCSTVSRSTLKTSRRSLAANEERRAPSAGALPPAALKSHGHPDQRSERALRRCLFHHGHAAPARHHMRGRVLSCGLFLQPAGPDAERRRVEPLFRDAQHGPDRPHPHGEAAPAVGCHGSALRGSSPVTRGDDIRSLHVIAGQRARPFYEARGFRFVEATQTKLEPAAVLRKTSRCPCQGGCPR